MPTAQTQGEADSKSDQFRKEMAERAGGMLSYAEVAARLGSGVEVVDEQYRQRRLLGVTYQGRVGFPAAQFVDKEQGFTIGKIHEVLHIPQMGTIGAQFMLYGLCIADMDHELLKYTHPGIRTQRYQQPALQHHLQQSYRF